MTRFETLRTQLIGQLEQGDIKNTLDTISSLLRPEHNFWQNLTIPPAEEEISQVENPLSTETIQLLIERLGNLNEDDLDEQWPGTDDTPEPALPSNPSDDPPGDNIIAGDVPDMPFEEEAAINIPPALSYEILEAEPDPANDSDPTEVISFDSLKNKLIREIRDKDDFQVPFEVLETIVVRNATLLDDLLLLKTRREVLRREFNRGSLAWETYKIDLNQILAVVSECLQPLRENDLTDTWRTTGAVKSLMNIEQGPGGDGDAPPEVQVELAKIELPAGESRAGLQDEKIHKFKQLMIKSQDEIGSGNYQLAYDLSEKASRIIGDLPQVYEFMLLSFLKHETPEQIVQKALEGSDQLFKRLNVYAQKLKTLASLTVSDKKDSEKTKRKRTPPGFANSLHEAAYAMLAELKRRYFMIRFDYISSDTDNQVERQKMRSILEFAKRVYEIYPSLNFIHILQTEICGAGKFDWLKVDTKFKLTNKTSFDAIKYWQDIEKISKEAVTVQNKKTPGREISDLFYFPLIKKYALIKLDYKDTDIVRLAKRKRVIRIVEAWKVAYKMTTDKRFLQKAISELSGEQEFTWIMINQNGELDQHPACRPVRYNPLEELPALLQQEGKNSDTYLQDLKEAIRKDNLAWTEHFYEKMIHKKQTITTPDWPGEPDDRKRILRCLFNWRVSFILTHDTTFLDKIRDELSGQGIFPWFDFSAKGEVKVKLMLPYYNPVQEVPWLLEQTAEPEGAGFFIAHAIFNDLQATYNSIPDLNADNSTSYLTTLRWIIQKGRFCFHLHPDPVFLRLPQEELNTCRKFKWFDRIYLIDRHFNLPHEACIKINFNPLAELTALREALYQYV